MTQGDYLLVVESDVRASKRAICSVGAFGAYPSPFQGAICFPKMRHLTTGIVARSDQQAFPMADEPCQECLPAFVPRLHFLCRWRKDIGAQRACSLRAACIIALGRLHQELADRPHASLLHTSSQDLNARSPGFRRSEFRRHLRYLSESRAFRRTRSTLLDALRGRSSSTMRSSGTL